MTTDTPDKRTMRLIPSLHHSFALTPIEAPEFSMPDEDVKKVILLAKEAGMPVKGYYRKDEVDKLCALANERIVFLQAEVQRLKRRGGIEK